MNAGWESHVDRKIREAMENGEFEELQGRGRPLDLEDNPFEAQEKWAAHRLLKSNGFTLPWITRRNEILTALERAKGPLLQTHARCQERLSFRPHDKQAVSWLTRAKETYRQRILEINKQIDDYNLMAPSDAFRITRRHPDTEMGRLFEDCG